LSDRATGGLVKKTGESGRVHIRETRVKLGFLIKRRGREKIPSAKSNNPSYEGREKGDVSSRGGKHIRLRGKLQTDMPVVKPVLG